MNHSINKICKFAGVLLACVILINFVCTVRSGKEGKSNKRRHSTRFSSLFKRPNQEELIHWKELVDEVKRENIDEPLEDEKSTVTRISYLNKPMVKASEQISARDMRNSYVIENTRFVEEYPKRCCSASTILTDPIAFEPNFFIARPDFDRKLKATTSLGEILATGFDPKQATTVVIHGFKHAYPKFEWLRTVRNLFRDHSLLGRQNLIFMDWEVAAKERYSKAAAWASAMGSFLANFLMKLIELGSDPKKIHLIGHSLGAHICGFAAKRIRPQIGRVTGLDPAGPCFGKVFLNSPDDRLSSEDALQVEVYHYDDKFFGSPDLKGKIDVFVNGGRSQPGCKGAINSLKTRTFTPKRPDKSRPPSENHRRAVQVATTYMPRTMQCQMIAYECKSWDAFQAGECGYCDQANNQCFQMNFSFQSDYDQEYVQKPEPVREWRAMSLYIATNEQQPFCVHHFQIKVTTTESNPVNSARLWATSNKQPKFDFKLTDIQDAFSEVTVSHQMEPDVFTHLLLSDRKERFTKVHISVNSQKRSSIKLVEINYMSNIDPAVRERLSSRFCPGDQIESIDDFRWIELEAC